jgi:hypothetical protein
MSTTLCDIITYVIIFYRTQYLENKSNKSNEYENHFQKENIDKIETNVTDEEEEKNMFEEESVFSKEDFTDRDTTIVSDDETNSETINNQTFDYRYLMEIQHKYENGIETKYQQALTPSLFVQVPPTINFVMQEENSMFYFIFILDIVF